MQSAETVLGVLRELRNTNRSLESRLRGNSHGRFGRRAPEKILRNRNLAGVLPHSPPLLAFCDNTNEALAGILRPDRAGSNTAADHIDLPDLALAQIPHVWRDKPILVRSDDAGFSHALLTHLSGQGWAYSVGWPVTETVRAAIATLLKRSWPLAIEVDGSVREGPTWPN
jgi:hypothetical protein